ncbi:MAG: hypothetical protein JW724_02975 [Candidatus Altiarchaeota archaeon]|nr:hypothetical protein [Candidatus Altiarchaeota archaeon]
MTESIESILKEGYAVWRRNLILGVPFVLSALASLVIVGCAVALVVFVLNPVGIDFPDTSVDYGLLFADGLLLLLAGILILLVSAFFKAGAIGMAAEAVRKGHTGLDPMFEYGSRRFLQIFALDVLLSVATILPVLVLGVPAALVALAFGGTGGQFLLQLLVFMSTLLGVLFAAAPYAIVVSGRGVLDGLRDSFLLLKKKKIPYLLLWVFGYYLDEYLAYIPVFAAGTVFAVMFLAVPLNADMFTTLQDAPMQALNLLTSLSLAFALGMAVFVLGIFLVSALVIAPLTTVWWSRFYLKNREVVKE